MRNKLNELCVAVMVAVVSDLFGVPPTPDDERTASGFPLQDYDPEQVNKWTRDITHKFKWMFDSKIEMRDDEVQTTAALVKAAFEGDDDAAEQLEKMYHTQEESQ
jgi:hypothetical protein